MKFILQRYSDNGESTQGLMHEIVGDTLEFQNYCLEDEHRAVKIKGETCIPAGIYQIKQRKVLSGMTKKYQAKYDWFEWHLELQNVEGFKYVYIHTGNTDKHTDGCLLVQDRANNNMIVEGFNGSSAPAYERLYKKITYELNDGRPVFILIRDVNHLL